MNENQNNKQKGFWKEMITYFIFTALVVIPTRLFIVQPFVVEGQSMEPTFTSGQYVVVDEISYRFNEPKRGDVIVLRSPINKKIYNIKRVIGLPNETIVIKKDIVSIMDKNNLTSVLDEPYIKYTVIDEKNIKITLNNDEFFVMGDNRPESLDSRSWGVLPRELIIGRTILRLLPINTATFFPGFPE